MDECLSIRQRRNDNSAATDKCLSFAQVNLGIPQAYDQSQIWKTSANEFAKVACMHRRGGRGCGDIHHVGMTLSDDIQQLAFQRFRRDGLYQAALRIQKSSESARF